MAVAFGRVEMGLSQAELAEKMGIARIVFTRLEADQALPNEQEWQKLAALLGHEAGLKMAIPNMCLGVGNLG